MGQSDKIKIEDFKPSESISAENIKASSPGGLNIVHTKRYGNRIGISKLRVLDYLADPEQVQISFYGRYLAIASYISEENITYQLRKNGKNSVLYNTALVHEIIDEFSLDYSERSSITFPVYFIEEREEGNIVYIDMDPEHEDEDYEDEEQ